MVRVERRRLLLIDFMDTLKFSFIRGLKPSQRTMRMMGLAIEKTI
jgi:hypothetical protein